MQTAVFFDPADAADIRRARDYLAGLADALDRAPVGLRVALAEILGLASGELLRLAHRHFGTGRFTLRTLAPLAGREVASLHSLAANLGRACDQRNVDVFSRHGGQPLELSIRPEVARLLEDMETENP